jgi:hypothetical protein
MASPCIILEMAESCGVDEELCSLDVDETGRCTTCRLLLGILIHLLDLLGEEIYS